MSLEKEKQNNLLFIYLLLVYVLCRVPWLETRELEELVLSSQSLQPCSRYDTNIRVT